MKNVPDTMLARARRAINELPEPGGSRWGKRIFLHSESIEGQLPRTSITAIATDAMPVITPMVVSLRFSLDGKTFTPEVPGAFGGEVRVELVEMIDVKTGPFREDFTLEAGDRQPFCGVVCQALQVSVTIIGENVQLWVQAFAAPTTTIDCADVVGPAETTPAGIVATTTARYPAVTASTYNIAADANRGLLVVVNQSAVNLFLHLGNGVSITPGDEFATVVLPANAFAGYEVTNYRGEIYFRFDADDGTGYALVTQGTY